MSIEITAPNGSRARILPFGARLQSLCVPDRDGRLGEVVLGYPDPQSYVRDTAYIGGIVGRYANRIASGRFTLDGRIIDLPRNDGANHLHGGPVGFDRRDWQTADRDAHSVTLTLRSEDGDQGYPGALDVVARYAFDDASALTLDLSATADAPTIVNLTHHAYWNLAGPSADETVGDHVLTIPASRFTPVTADAIPTGALDDVTGTAFDLRQPRRVGDAWTSDAPQLVQFGGYDHNFAIDSAPGALREVARLFEPVSGRVLTLSSTAPGVQFYTGNGLASIDPGHAGVPYRARQGLCLEPQAFPDSPNRSTFPSARIDPGQSYRHQIRFAFTTASSAEATFGA